MTKNVILAISSFCMLAAGPAAYACYDLFCGDINKERGDRPEFPEECRNKEQYPRYIDRENCAVAFCRIPENANHAYCKYLAESNGKANPLSDPNKATEPRSPAGDYASAGSVPKNTSGERPASVSAGVAAPKVVPADSAVPDGGAPHGGTPDADAPGSQTPAQ